MLSACTFMPDHMFLQVVQNHDGGEEFQHTCCPLCMHTHTGSWGLSEVAANHRCTGFGEMLGLPLVEERFADAIEHGNGTQKYHAQYAANMWKVLAALAASLELLGEMRQNERATILARALDQATGKVLENKRSPSRKVGEIDNRGSHFYLALYWAQALAAQDQDVELKQHFAPIAQQLESNESKIVEELDAVQGNGVDLGGYYHPDPQKVRTAMRSSHTLNAIIG